MRYITILDRFYVLKWYIICQNLAKNNLFLNFYNSTCCYPSLPQYNIPIWRPKFSFHTRYFYKGMSVLAFLYNSYDPAFISSVHVAITCKLDLQFTYCFDVTDQVSYLYQSLAKDQTQRKHFWFMKTNPNISSVNRL